MIVIGLTGSIAMGKSTVSRVFRQSFGVQVWDADEAVHRLYREDTNLIHTISDFFPKSMVGGEVDRKRLGHIVFNDPDKLDLLEEIIHPRLEKVCHTFLHKCRLLGQPICVLDVPLLFEIGWNTWCDKTVLVSATSYLQHHRLKRRGMEDSETDGIIHRQMRDEQKRLLADFVVRTSLSKNYLVGQIQKVLASMCFVAVS